MLLLQHLEFIAHVPMWRAYVPCLSGNKISLPVVAILHSAFVIVFYKMALLFTDQVHPDINKTLAVIGCDRFSALPLLRCVQPLTVTEGCYRAQSSHREVPGVIGFDGYWLLQ